MSEIITKIDNTVTKYKMITAGDIIVAGVSGGADSMLLLNYLISVKNKFDIRIIVANVEHGIRGAESKNDTEFVRCFCEKNGVEFHCLEIDAVGGAKRAGIGVEEYSRNVRYEFFNSLGGTKIATAHNLSDNVETVIFRLARGTSLNGCRGIPPVRDNIIRPLIECSSDEIRSYCSENGIDFVVDSTNFDDKYTRNYIRNKLIHDFEHINPSFLTAFNRFISSANEDNHFLTEYALSEYKKCVDDKGIIISRLKSLDKSIQKRIVINYLKQHNLAVDELHLNEILSLCDRNGKSQIKGSFFAVSSNNYLKIASFAENERFCCKITERKLLSRSQFLMNCELLTKKFDFYCDCDKIDGEIGIRQRKEGDFIRPLGRNCTKSLKKLFNELKVPTEKRNSIPIIFDSKGVLGVLGYCIDERAAMSDTTKNVLLIKVAFDTKPEEIF